jgi:hypothetical protein
MISEMGAQLAHRSLPLVFRNVQGLRLEQEDLGLLPSTELAQ